MELEDQLSQLLELLSEKEDAMTELATLRLKEAKCARELKEAREKLNQSRTASEQ